MIFITPKRHKADIAMLTGLFDELGNDIRYTGKRYTELDKRLNIAETKCRVNAENQDKLREKLEVLNGFVDEMVERLEELEKLSDIYSNYLHDDHNEIDELREYCDTLRDSITALACNNKTEVYE